MSVTIRNKLPKGDTNGLAGLEKSLADDPDRVIVVAGLVRADSIELRPHDDDDPRLVKCVLLHIEPLEGRKADAVEKALRQEYQSRSGKAELPLYDDDGGESS